MTKAAVLGEEQKQKVDAIQFLIQDYLQGDESSTEILYDSSCGFTAQQKILLQQIIRKRAEQDGQNLDELIDGERAKNGMTTSKPRGQVLGVLSRVECLYADILIQEVNQKQEEALASGYHK